MNDCYQDRSSACPGRVVCHCLQVTEDVLVEAITTLELRSVREVRSCTGAGDGCTACHRTIVRYIQLHGAESALPICSAR